MDRKVIQTSRIFKTMDLIEAKAQTMVHEIPELKDITRLWQKGQISNGFMQETLNKYIDKLNGQE